MSRAILVTGATGRQGGAVITNLLKMKVPFNILAVTRNPSSASAQRLAAKSPSIKVIQGDLEKANEIFATAKQVTPDPIWGVYSVQSSINAGVSPTREIAQGKGLVDAALANNVNFFVYSSVDRGTAQDETYIPHFASKHEIETYLESRTAAGFGKMGWFIVRPTGFMETMTEGFIGKISGTCWKVGVSKSKKMQFISTDDIGWFAAQGFANSEKWKGKRLSLVGWEGTWEEGEAAWKRKTGRSMPGTYEWLSTSIMWLVKDFKLMMKWFDEVGFAADLQEVRVLHPGVMGMEEYIERSGLAIGQTTANV